MRRVVIGCSRSQRKLTIISEITDENHAGCKMLVALMGYAGQSLSCYLDCVLLVIWTDSGFGFLILIPVFGFNF